MNNKINFNEFFNSLIATCVVLLSCLAIIVTLIETPSALLLVLIFAIFATAFIVIDSQDNENVRRN